MTAVHKGFLSMSCSTRKIIIDLACGQKTT